MLGIHLQYYSKQEFEDAMKKTEDRTKVSFDSNVFDILKKEIGEFSLTI